MVCQKVRKKVLPLKSACPYIYAYCTLCTWVPVACWGTYTIGGTSYKPLLMIISLLKCCTSCPDTVSRLVLVVTLQAWITSGAGG